jgi:hypothetical protein
VIIWRDQAANFITTSKGGLDYRGKRLLSVLDLECKMGPKKSSSSKKAALSPNIAYLNTEIANLGVDLSGAGSSSQYQTPIPQLEQDLSAMSPLGNFDLTSVERAMLLLGSHETDLATSGLVPDLNLSDGKLFLRYASYLCHA